ncbi:MAG: redoxin domain-containing protein [Bryobacteraceae bacterium]|nr:redoxin domain-containing protein [Bryobacteraceae bacterium]
MRSTPRWKKWAIAAAVALGVYAAAFVAFFQVMRRPPDEFGRIMARLPMPLMMVFPFQPMWNVARGGSLQVGQPAPDFALPRRDTGDTVRLREFRGHRPVVLVFGSYT